MNIYRVALFGHRDFDAHEKLEKEFFPILNQLSTWQPILIAKYKTWIFPPLHRFFP